MRMGLEGLEIGAPGPFLPPFDSVVRNARTVDRLGYASMAFPDHFAGFIPESLWTPDITPLARLQRSPHTYYEMSTIMAACAMATERVALVSAVTEPIRRHPVLLAQTFLTLDHISRGRVVLGIGAGERENVEPYGLDYSHQVGRLREALAIIRTVWQTHEPFDFEGRFWRLRGAVMSLRPFVPDRPPPIWVAAHGPKMLRIAAEYGDGWIPTLLSPKDYGDRLRAIFRYREEAGVTRPFTAALWNWCILNREPDVCWDLARHPIARAFALLCPASEWERLGHSHPFGPQFNALTDYVPMGLSRRAITDAIDRVPDTILSKFYMLGDADDIIKGLEEYVKHGLQHIILWNLTGMLDPSLTRESFAVMRRVLEYVRDS